MRRGRDGAVRCWTSCSPRRTGRITEESAVIASDAKQSPSDWTLCNGDCFVAALLAMTTSFLCVVSACVVFRSKNWVPGTGPGREAGDGYGNVPKIVTPIAVSAVIRATSAAARRHACGSVGIAAVRPSTRATVRRVAAQDEDMLSMPSTISPHPEREPSEQSKDAVWFAARGWDRGQITSGGRQRPGRSSRRKG